MWCTFSFLFDFFVWKFLNVNTVDPDQMLCSVATDLDLHCLPRSHYGKLGTNGLRHKS